MSNLTYVYDALADAIETQLAAYSITITDQYPRWSDPDVTLPTAALAIMAGTHRKRRTGESQKNDWQFALIMFAENEHDLLTMSDTIVTWLRNATITANGSEYRALLASADRHENKNDIEAEDHAFDILIQINGV